MRVNVAKTNILVCSQNPKMKTKTYFDYQKPEQVNEIIYVGNKITSDD